MTGERFPARWLWLFACLTAASVVAACSGSAVGQTNRQAAPPPSSLPPGVVGVLTYQRDGNIYNLPLDSKTERKLTDFSPVTPAVFSARSNDGTRLAYVRVEGLGTVLWVSNADGSEPRKLVDASSAGATIERPQWTPDGSAILYTYHGFIIEGTRILGEQYRVDRADAATGVTTTLIEEAEGPTQAPNGAIAFVRTTRTGQQLVVRDSAGAERVLIAERIFPNLAAARFSRDGQRIAFSGVGEGPQSGQRPGGADRLAAGRAGWPDWLRLNLGPRTAYAHGEPWDIWLAELGGAVRRVAKLTEDEPTSAWSDDDRFLAVSGGTGVYTIDVANGQTTQLAKVGGFGGIDWTP